MDNELNVELGLDTGKYESSIDGALQKFNVFQKTINSTKIGFNTNQIKEMNKVFSDIRSTALTELSKIQHRMESLSAKGVKLDVAYEMNIEKMKSLQKEIEITWNAKSRAKLENQLAAVEAKLEMLDGELLINDDSLKDAKAEYDKLLQELQSNPLKTHFESTPLVKYNSEIENVIKNTKRTGEKFEEAGNKADKMANKASKGAKRISTRLNLMGRMFSQMKNTIAAAISPLNIFRKIWNGTIMTDTSKFGNAFKTVGQNILNYMTPAFEKIAQWIINLIGYVNILLKALSGGKIDLFKKTSKSASSTAKSTKEAAKNLAGFDELNNIGGDSGGGDDGGIGDFATPTIDTSAADKFLAAFEKIKAIMEKMFEPIKKSWDTYGPALITSIINAFTGVASLVGSILGSVFEVWTNGTGEKITSNILKGWTDIFNIIGNIGTALSKAWDNGGKGTVIVQAVADAYNSLLEIVVSIFNSLAAWTLSPEFQAAIDVVVQLVSDLFNYLGQIATWLATMYETYLAPVVDKVLAVIAKVVLAIGAIWTFLEPVIQTILDVLKDVLTPAIEAISGVIGGIVDALGGVMDFIIGVFTGDWEKAWNGIKDFFGGIIDAIAALFKGLFDIVVAVFKGAWDIIKSVWDVVSTWFKTKVIEPLSNVFTKAWDGIKSGASKAWEGIKSVFSSVATFFKNIFTNAWTAVKNVFSTGGKIFDGIKEGIVASFKAVVNAIIKGINKVVAIPFDAINGTLNTIRNVSFLGISPFKGLWKQNPLPVPQIPTLAVGTEYVPNDTLAYIHEGEAVIPKKFNDKSYFGNNDNEETNRLLTQVLDAINDIDFSPYTTIKDVGKASVEYIKEKSRALGRSVV